MIDPEEYVAEPAKELLASAGREVELVNQAVATDADGNVIRDEYGDPDTTESVTTTQAEVVVRGTPEFNQRAGDSDVDVQAYVWVADDHADAVDDGSETDSPTRVRFNQDVTGLDDDVLEVIRVHDELNGKLRLATQGA